MRRFIKIGEASKILGVSISTLRRWEVQGSLIPALKSSGNTRYYSMEQLMNEKTIDVDLTVGYARVSSHDQKNDLKTQAASIEAYCACHGWNFEIIQDLGSGMNYRKKGLKTLLEYILTRKVKRLVLTHKDRLLRFGAELIFALCEAKNIEVVLMNQAEDLSFEEELAQDVLEIITVFSARLYGSRSRKNQKLIEAAKVLINEK